MVNKYRKLHENVLKSITTEYYSAEEIATAKRLLLKDTEMVKNVTFQHYVNDSDIAEGDVDDMIGILT